MKNAAAPWNQRSFARTSSADRLVAKNACTVSPPEQRQPTATNQQQLTQPSKPPVPRLRAMVIGLNQEDTVIYLDSSLSLGFLLDFQANSGILKYCNAWVSLAICGADYCITHGYIVTMSEPSTQISKWKLPVLRCVCVCARSNQ